MKYEKITYPDGQISAKISGSDGSTVIRERINSYEDLFYIKSIVEAWKAAGWYNPELFIPCLFGQRSDRRFDPNQSFDLKIIADFINSCDFGSVSILDPHSDVSLALINNSRRVKPTEYVEKAITSLTIPYNNLTLVSPDAGAYKKVFEYGETYKLPVVAAVKHRNTEGTVHLKFMGEVKGKDCLIIDDLCDGGYTFIVLARQLKLEGAKDVYLYVSHGYFSKGFLELQKDIKHIFCTNSVKDIQNDYITQFKVV